MCNTTSRDFEFLKLPYLLKQEMVSLLLETSVDIVSLDADKKGINMSRIMALSINLKMKFFL